MPFRLISQISVWILNKQEFSFWRCFVFGRSDVYCVRNYLVFYLGLLFNAFQPSKNNWSKCLKSKLVWNPNLSEIQTFWIPNFCEFEFQTSICVWKLNCLEIKLFGSQTVIECLKCILCSLDFRRLLYVFDATLSFLQFMLRISEALGFRYYLGPYSQSNLRKFLVFYVTF